MSEVQSTKEKEPAVAEQKFTSAFKTAQKPTRQQGQQVVMGRQQQQQPPQQQPQNPQAGQQPPQQFPSMQPQAPQRPNTPLPPQQQQPQQQQPQQQQPQQQQPQQQPQRQVNPKFAKQDAEAEECLKRLEEQVAKLRAAKHERLAAFEERLSKLQADLNTANAKDTYAMIVQVANQATEAGGKALGQANWQKVQASNQVKDLPKATYATLDRMYKVGEKDSYKAFNEAATYELDYLTKHKARWEKVEKGLKAKAAETRKQALMVSLLPGNEHMVEVGKKADTLWNDAELAAEMKKDYKLAADLGQQILMLERDVKAAAKQVDPTIADAGKDWQKLQQLIDKSRQVLNKLIVDLPTIEKTEMFKSSKDVNAAAAEKIKYIFDDAVTRQDATHVSAAIKQLNELQIGWTAYQDVADKWDKEEGERGRKRQMAIALIDLSAKKNYPQNADLHKLVLNYLEKLRTAEDLAKPKTVESKIRAAEHETKHAESQFSTTETVRNEFEKWLAKQLQADVDLIIRQKKGAGPEAKMMEAMNSYDYQSECAGLLVKAEQLKFAANQSTSKLKIPETLSVAHVAALHLYTKQSDCQRMQTYLRGPGQGEPEQTEERKKTMKTLVDLAKEGMALLPAFKEESTRGESAWPGAEEQYKEGNTFTINSFWSTAFGVAFPGTYQITIRPNPQKASGRQIDAFSQFYKENEVLYPPGAKFLVKSKTGNLQDGFKVLVQEV